MPDDVDADGPADRALQWVAHTDRYAVALSQNTTDTVQNMTGLTRPTAGRWIARAREAGRWIARAREAGYLEPVKGN